MNALSQAIAALPSRFTENGDGTVTDHLLRVMWTKDTLSAANVTQYDAEKICADCRVGGHEGWRLPDVEELFLLADRSRREPAIDTAFFPDTHSDWYWTRTIAAGAPRAAWIVGFGLGLSYLFLRGSYSAFVRAVRSLPAGQ
ncbi:MAG TPA: DUF1566 domain-containing protein [Xanthomonadaceae bacterium]